MKSKKLGLFLTLALVLTSVFAFAQDAPKEEESPIKISGGVNFFYTLDAGYVSKATAANSLYQNYFSFDKIYLEFDHQIGKNFKYHLTLDAIANTSLSQSSSATLAANQGYWAAVTGPTQRTMIIPFVREAYATLTLGDAELLKVDVNVGLIPTKIIRYRGYMSDMRWVESMMFNGNAQIIGAPYLGIVFADGKGDGDAAQDLGIGIDLSFMKFLNLSVAVTAGEGVTQVTQDFNAANSGKAVLVDLLVVPMKGIFAHGYFRHEATQFINSVEPTWNGVGKQGQKITKWFAGAGVGMKLMGINLGADFESGQQITEADTAAQAAAVGVGGEGKYAKNFFVLNAWLNWNLQEIAGFPLIVLGKFSYGSYTAAPSTPEVNASIYAATLAQTGSVAAATGNSMLYSGRPVVVDTVHWYAGLGWQFNKNFRVAVIFEQYVYSDALIYMSGMVSSSTIGKDPYNVDAMNTAKTSNAGWNNANSKLYIKTESKF